MDNYKIGIITFHAAENFGSALQAFALQHVLIKKGFDAEIIDCTLESDMEQYKLFRTQYYKERPKAFLGDILYLKKNFRRKYNYKEFRKKYLKMSAGKFQIGKDDLENLNNEYNVFICGSDQIWNLNCTGGFISEFFLNFADNTSKKISYAPSMPEAVSPVYYGKIKASLERFDAISVRENQTIAY